MRGVPELEGHLHWAPHGVPQRMSLHCFRHEILTVGAGWWVWSVVLEGMYSIEWMDKVDSVADIERTAFGGWVDCFEMIDWAGAMTDFHCCIPGNLGPSVGSGDLRFAESTGAFGVR